MFLKFIANYMVILPFELSYSFQAYEVSSYENLFILLVHIYEMSSSYTWCNSYKLTHFLHCRFLRNLTVKKTSSNAIVFYFIT